MAVGTGHARLWAASGLAFIVFFVGGILFADVLVPGGVSHRYPRTDQSLDVISTYLTRNHGQVRALACLHALAALALVVFATAAVTMLRSPGPDELALSIVAIGGAAVGATFLLASSAFFRVVVMPSVVGNPDILLAMFNLPELTGGVAFLAPLGLFVGATTLLDARRRVLPRFLAVGGVVVALACLWAVTGLLTQTGPARLLSLFGLPLFLLWTLATSIVLVRAAGRST